MIIIIDYGVGNLHSIQSKIDILGHKALISSKQDDIKRADKFILPGVGFFAEGMKNLISYGFLETLKEKVLLEKTPILGICLGMQLMTGHSEEGGVDGLKWIDAQTKKFNFAESNEKLRIPHVGWNTVSILKDSILFRNIPRDERFYFTHSYYVTNNSRSDIVAETDYGNKFTAVFQKENIYGTQFHPEKSHKHGLQMIDNFLRYA